MNQFASEIESSFDHHKTMFTNNLNATLESMCKNASHWLWMMHVCKTSLQD